MEFWQVDSECKHEWTRVAGHGGSVMTPANVDVVAMATAAVIQTWTNLAISPSPQPDASRHQGAGSPSVSNVSNIVSMYTLYMLVLSCPIFVVFSNGAS
jgi:hypothetical protein